MAAITRPARPAVGGPAVDLASGRRHVGMATILAGTVLVGWSSAPLWVLLAGLTLAVAVGLPLALSGTRFGARVLLPIALVLVAVAGAWAPMARMAGDGPLRYRTHDGGVIVTREAARLTIGGENPYTATYGGVLPPSWAEVQAASGAQIPNPVIDHQPYLPASFLVQVPFELGSRVLGVTWDPRVLCWLALVGTALLLARRPGPAWARAGAVLTLGSAFTVTYLSWGTCDSLSVCAFVAALAWAESRPRSAGVLLALAISCKFLFLVGVAPLALVLVRRHGWSVLRRWWTLPAVLGATCVPYLLASPVEFLDDVLWFNLGRSEPKMPTSGLGLPALAPGLAQGWVLLVLTVVGVAVAFGLVPWLADRWRSLAAVGPLTSLALLGLLVPARTFQVNYLVLVVAATATAWWAVAD